VEQQLSEAFESLDANKDGVLSPAELATGLGVFATGPQQDKIAALFRLYDTNKDGFVSRAEMESMLLATFRALASRDGFDVPQDR